MSHAPTISMQPAATMQPGTETVVAAVAAAPAPPLQEPDDRPFKCGECSKSFKRIHYLRTHLRTHAKGQSGRGSSSSALINHLTGREETSGMDPKATSCQYCRKVFKYPSALQIHLRTHTKVQPFECPICHKCFSQRSHLKKHLNSSMHPNLHICTYCDKPFKYPSALHMHERTHTGRQPFECTLCQKTFKQKSHLKTHMKSSIHRDQSQPLSTAPPMPAAM